MQVNFDLAAFRLQFPGFANAITYPDQQMAMYWDMATVYISDQRSGCNYLTGKQQTLALNFMTAHLAQIATLINSGETPGIVQAATIDKISVTLTPPPLPNQWQYWLNTTPYGQQLLALLQQLSVGGFFVSSGQSAQSGFNRGFRARRW